MAEIVVGVDGSEHSVDALRWAAREAQLRGVTMKVVASFATPIMGLVSFVGQLLRLFHSITSPANRDCSNRRTASV